LKCDNARDSCYFERLRTRREEGGVKRRVLAVVYVRCRVWMLIEFGVKEENRASWLRTFLRRKESKGEFSEPTSSAFIAGSRSASVTHGNSYKMLLYV
jgi:hypothetical protein